MKVSLENISSNKKSLSFEVPSESYQERVEKAYVDLRKEVKLKGFRPGKVPLEIVKKNYAGQVERDVLSKLMEESYQKAVAEHELMPISHPDFSDLKAEENQAITFKAVVDVQPDVVVQGYEGISIAKEEAKLDEGALEAELVKIQGRFAQLIPVEKGGIEKQDIVTLDYKGELNGEAHDELASESAVLDVGSGQYLPDFESGILGQKKGETREIDVKFPEDYPAEKFRGQTVKFKITITEHKRKDMPELDDELAKDQGQFETLAELKEDISKQLLVQKEKQIQSAYYQKIIDHLVEKHPIDIPESMTDRELKFMYENTLEQLKARNVDPVSIDFRYDKFIEENRKDAEKKIASFLVLDSVAKQEKLQVLPEDIEAHFTQMAAQYSQPVEQIRDYYQKNQLINSLVNQKLTEKVLALLLDKAQIS